MSLKATFTSYAPVIGCRDQVKCGRKRPVFLDPCYPIFSHVAGLLTQPFLMSEMSWNIHALVKHSND